MRKITYFLVIITLVLGYTACKDKPEKKVQKPVNKTVVKKKVKKDTTAIDSAKLAATKKVVKQPEPPKPADRYFLIAGSFQDRAMAEAFKKKLDKEGYEARVLERPNGPNNEFYKVSYKGFHDKKEAYRALRDARGNGDIEGVWLMIQK